MSPISGAVLTGATLMASPALWSSLVEGSMPLEVALTRYLIAVAICWVLMSLVAEFALPSAKARHEAETALARAEDQDAAEPDRAA